jgi:16S rRNA (uracil1498-N3)-methyltransferase
MVVSEDSVAAVGPEGGFTPEEIGLGQRNGWQTIDLGPRTLRIETAALVLATWATTQSVSRS